MNIRTAQPEDCGQLAGLSTQLGYPSSPDQVARRLSAIQARPEAAVFVAEVDGSLAGWVHVFECRTVESEPFAEIGGLVVDESRRGRGVGRALMAQAEDWARGRGLAEVRLRSNVVRGDAHRFYQAVGYAILKSQFTFGRKL